MRDSVSRVLQDAEKRMEDLLNGPRLDPDAMHTLALTELKLGRPQEAIQYLERALNKFPKHLASSVTLASAKLAQNDLKGAEQVLRDACGKAPDSPANAALWRFFMFLQRYPDAEQQFQTALRISPITVRRSWIWQWRSAP